ncbi:MAG: hypothetical protein M3464_18010 [Chloroflexota bacterium]|nr:hypothetical protein [Chloroflexota bacterium]
MIRRLMSLAMLVILSLAVILGGSGARVGAQEAIPEPVPPTFTGDIVFRESADFGILDADTLPAAPASLTLFRVEFAPGAGVTVFPGDPGPEAHLIESGTLTLRNFTKDILVTRAVSQATPEAVTPEVLPAGAETQLGPGDGFLLISDVGGEFRNDGTEPVMMAIVGIYP